MVWAPFWLPKPSRRPSRRHPKKYQFLTPTFTDFSLFWAPPRSPEIVPKTFRGVWAVLPFWLQKRFCYETGLQDAILDDFGFQNVYFGRVFSSIFCIWDVFYQQQPCKLQDIMCLATVRLARHRSSSSRSSSSSLARHAMSCNILSRKSQQQEQEQQASK